MVIQRKRSTTGSLLWLAMAIPCLTPSLSLGQPAKVEDDPAPGAVFINEEAAVLDTPGQGSDLTDPDDSPEEQMQISVSPEGDVEMHIQDGDLYVVLQRLLFLTRKNIVFGRDVQGEVTVSLYNVTLEQALDSILKQNGFCYLEEGSFIYIYTQEECEEIAASARRYVIEVMWLNYIAPSDAVVLLEPFLEGQQAEIIIGPEVETGLQLGGGETSGLSYAIEDLILVRDYEDNMDNIREMLALIDKRPKQVLVEATILRVSLNDSDVLGVDFNFLGGVDFELLQNSSFSSLRHGPNVTAAEGGGEGGQGGGGQGGEGGEGGAENASEFGRLTNTVPLSKLDDLTFGLATEFASGVPQGGLSIGLVTDQVSVFIRAMEQVKDISVLANPKLLVLNKQNGSILVGSRSGYVGKTISTTTSEVSEVQFLETGTQLSFRPFIGNDGYIRMEITPSDSSGGVEGGLPHEDTTELTTNVLVKDGHTIMLGGMFREDTRIDRTQVPFLGNLPILGEAFQSSGNTVLREEVIVLLTVSIVDDEDMYAQQSRELLEDFERARVGLREGVGAHGRERLAQVNYQKAVNYDAEGDLERALWHVKSAIHNRPTFINAIKLKEKLLQKRAWEDEGSLIRHFLQNLLLRKQGLPERLFERPPLPGRRKFEESTGAEGQDPPQEQSHDEAAGDEIEEAMEEIEIFPPVGQQSPALERK